MALPSLLYPKHNVIETIMKHHPIIGAFLCTLAALFFTLLYACYKISNAYIPSSLTVFFQSLFSLIIVLPIACKNGVKNLYSPMFPYIAIRTIAGLITLVCISTALLTINLANVIVLNNTAPLFIPFISWIGLKEKISHKIWFPLIVGFIGIIIILRPEFTEINIGLLFALISGLTSALLVVVASKIAHEKLSKIMFYYFLITCFILSPFLFTQWHSPPYMIWLYLALSGIAMILAQAFLTLGLRYASSQEAGSFLYMSVLFSGILDWIFWKTIPSTISLIGWLVVCLGGILTVILSPKKTAKP